MPALLASTQRASVAGLSAHGQLVTAQDAGLSGDAGLVALTTVTPGTTGQVLTVGDAGLPVWRAAAGGSTPTAGLDTARPSPTLGAIYTATDTGLRYLGESDGAGGTRWVALGSRWGEGRDTSAVLVSTSVTATSSITIDSGTAVSGATEIVRWHAAGTRVGVLTETAIGTIGGVWTWLAAPTVSVR